MKRILKAIWNGILSAVTLRPSLAVINLILWPFNLIIVHELYWEDDTPYYGFFVRNRNKEMACRELARVVKAMCTPECHCSDYPKND